MTRVLSLLSAVARGPKTLTALAGHSGVSLRTASRLLGILKSTGYVSQDTDGAYIPGPELISATDLWAGIRSIAMQTVGDLRARADAFFVAPVTTGCASSPRNPAGWSGVRLPGERSPIYLGPEGKALCAEIRERGHAYSARESTEESWSVAAPVYRQRTLVGVLAVLVPLARSDDDYVQRLTRLTCEVAAKRRG
ncbi:helix-turn-helix domain-containing protein [Amycolatopsis panacis]|uniref:helix-turn-helix domain-containing protein n=1 Tax=Amycolatopsis panacis TaxID=2340917 RepID=UPI0013145BE9|nr:IclR family transcriptional regulator C-terminal domain-containing protein [Amycolatopsis panacis]